jgi:hypothetical protein
MPEAASSKTKQASGVKPSALPQNKS